MSFQQVEIRNTLENQVNQSVLEAHKTQ